MVISGKGLAVVCGHRGFVGSAVVAALKRNGFEVFGVSVRPGPAQIPAELANQNGAPDLLVNAAGLAHRRLDEREAVREEVRIGAASVNVAVRTGARRIVHISSLAASLRLGPGTRPALRNHSDAYRAAKLAGEHEVSDLASQHRMPASVVRPSVMFGLGMKGNPARLWHIVAKAFPLPICEPDLPRPVSAVHNFSEWIASRSSAPASMHSCCEYVDWMLSIEELAQAIAQAHGRRLSAIRVPRWLASAGIRAADICAGFVRREYAVAGLAAALDAPVFESVGLPRTCYQGARRVDVSETMRTMLPAGGGGRHRAAL